jgi:sugar O-acyltransferase (sialic acid O-acetyltransferase NeuD family)
VTKAGIIGFGALGQQILVLVKSVAGVEHVVLFDDVLHAQRSANSAAFDSFLEPRYADHEFFVGLGYHHLPRRAAIVRELIGAGRRVPAWVHPSCQIDPAAHIGDGCLVYPLCNVGSHVHLAEGALLNNSVVVSHDSRIGAGVYLSPGVVISGHVEIGDASFLGAGALVANNRRIGAQARVGIGTVVTADVPDGGSAIGNPMRILDGRLDLD